MQKFQIKVEFEQMFMENYLLLCANDPCNLVNAPSF